MVHGLLFRAFSSILSSPLLPLFLNLPFFIIFDLGKLCLDLQICYILGFCDLLHCLKFSSSLLIDLAKVFNDWLELLEVLLQFPTVLSDFIFLSLDRESLLQLLVLVE